MAAKCHLHEETRHILLEYFLLKTSILKEVTLNSAEIIKGDPSMAETHSQEQTPKPDPEQPQTQSQQGTKGTQPVPLQGQQTSTQQTSNKLNVQGRAPTPEEVEQLNASAEYWRRIRDESVVQDMDKSEEAAKQLIGLMSALQVLYIAIYAFSDFRQQLGALNVSFPMKLMLSLLYFLPLLVWFVCLFYAARFFVGVRIHSGINLYDVSPDAWMHLKATYELAQEIRIKMLYSLRRSFEAMIVITAVALLLLGAFIFLAPQPAPAPTQIIIVTPTPHVVPTP